MDHADDALDFAKWLDLLVQIVLRVAHLHGGVFDKFTGDGAIVHFLDRECCRVLKMSASLLALRCAVDLVYVIGLHIELRLRPMLRVESELLGPCVGLDAAEATWTRDRNGSPVVVGRNVVYACRLTDKPAGQISLTNVVAQESHSSKSWDTLVGLSFQQAFRCEPVNTKEIPAEVRATVRSATDQLTETLLAGRRVLLMRIVEDVWGGWKPKTQRSC